MKYQMSKNSQLNRVRSYAFRLLKIRPRSEKELRFRLSQRKFDQKNIDLLVSSFKEVGYINDSEFASAWVRERIKKPLGFKRLEFELKQKGIDKEIIQSTLRQAREQYSEYEVVSELVKRRFARIIAKELDYKAKKKIQGFLLRRGFSNDAIMDVIDDL